MDLIMRIPTITRARDWPMPTFAAGKSHGNRQMQSVPRKTEKHVWHTRRMSNENNNATGKRMGEKQRYRRNN